MNQRDSENRSAQPRSFYDARGRSPSGMQGNLQAQSNSLHLAAALADRPGRQGDRKVVSMRWGFADEDDAVPRLPHICMCAAKPSIRGRPPDKLLRIDWHPDDAYPDLSNHWPDDPATRGLPNLAGRHRCVAGSGQGRADNVRQTIGREPRPSSHPAHVPVREKDHAQADLF